MAVEQTRSAVESTSLSPSCRVSSRATKRVFRAEPELMCPSGVRGLVDGIGSNISSFSKVFPVQTSVSNFNIFISHAHAKIEDHYPDIDKMDFYRYV